MLLQVPLHLIFAVFIGDPVATPQGYRHDLVATRYNVPTVVMSNFATQYLKWLPKLGLPQNTWELFVNAGGALPEDRTRSLPKEQKKPRERSEGKLASPVAAAQPSAKRQQLHAPRGGGVATQFAPLDGPSPLPPPQLQPLLLQLPHPPPEVLQPHLPLSPRSSLQQLSWPQPPSPTLHVAPSSRVDMRPPMPTGWTPGQDRYARAPEGTHSVEPSCDLNEEGGDSMDGDEFMRDLLEGLEEPAGLCVGQDPSDAAYAAADVVEARRQDAMQQELQQQVQAAARKCVEAEATTTGVVLLRLRHNAHMLPCYRHYRFAAAGKDATHTPTIKLSDSDSVCRCVRAWHSGGKPRRCARRERTRAQRASAQQQGVRGHCRERLCGRQPRRSAPVLW